MFLVQRAMLCLGLLGFCQSIRRKSKRTNMAKASTCAEAVEGGENYFWGGCRCPGDQVIVGPNADCVGKTGFEQYYNIDTLAGRGCRCELKESTVGQGFDGNPWGWDRYRRCDDTDYTPACGLCEGIGGIVDADEKTSVELAYCEVVASKEELDLDSIIRPHWSADFTVTHSEILIGIKNDAACFQAFPSNDSINPMCYKPQETRVSSDMVDARALRIDANQAGNAWGLVGNITSVIFHQYGNMWITNQLPFGITQTICTAPREGGDQTKPPVAPIQYNWTDNLIFWGRERIQVEYGVGTQTLDHWAYGPHHAWTNPQTGIIVRMWQPFNGLQILPPGSWQEGTDSSLFSELKPDGSQAPLAAQDGGSTFRIGCGADGFNEDAGAIMLGDDVTADALELASRPVGHQLSSTHDLQRARTKVPRAAYKGDTFDEMSQTLNGWLLKHAPNSKECDAWTVEELQRLQIQLFVLRDPQLDGVYQDTSDSRQLPVDLAETTKEWDELNSLAKSSPELQRIHRDGHCHEAVMWYVHHLPESVKAELKDKIALPLLSRMRHEVSQPVANVSMAARRVHKSYTYKVTCAACHSAVFPA